MKIYGSLWATKYYSKGEFFMGFVLGLVVVVLALFGCLCGDDGSSYEAYRRSEYRNEYQWEKRRRREGDYFLDLMAFRRP